MNHPLLHEEPHDFDDHIHPERPCSENIDMHFGGVVEAAKGLNEMVLDR